MGLNILEQVYKIKINFGNELFYKSREKMIERTYLGCNLIWMMM